jgi:hypothetical protein
MALEPAGVSLEAQGFSDYIKKLQQIEKKQREVFDAKFKGIKKRLMLKLKKLIE